MNFAVEEPATTEHVSSLTDAQLFQALRDITALIKPTTGGYNDAEMTHLSLGEDCPLREDRRGRSYAELPPQVSAYQSDLSIARHVYQSLI